MKTLMTATALTLSLGLAAPAGAADAINEGLPSERAPYEAAMADRMLSIEEEIEMMDVDPTVRNAWVELRQDFASLRDEEAGAWKLARQEFEQEYRDFRQAWSNAKASGMASNSSIPEERRAFEQATSYDLSRAEVGMYRMDQGQGLNMPVKEAWKEARADWYAMLQASGDDWAEARAQYLESWAEFQQAWLDAQSGS